MTRTIKPPKGWATVLDDIMKSLAAGCFRPRRTVLGHLSLSRRNNFSWSSTDLLSFSSSESVVHCYFEITSTRQEECFHASGPEYLRHVEAKQEIKFQLDKRAFLQAATPLTATPHPRASMATRRSRGVKLVLPSKQPIVSSMLLMVFQHPFLAKYTRDFQYLASGFLLRVNSLVVSLRLTFSTVTPLKLARPLDDHPLRAAARIRRLVLRGYSRGAGLSLLCRLLHGYLRKGAGLWRHRLGLSSMEYFTLSRPSEESTPGIDQSGHVAAGVSRASSDQTHHHAHGGYHAHFPFRPATAPAGLQPRVKLPSTVEIGTFDGTGSAERWLAELKWAFMTHVGNASVPNEVVTAINMRLRGGAAVFVTPQMLTSSRRATLFILVGRRREVR